MIALLVAPVFAEVAVEAEVQELPTLDELTAMLVADGMSEEEAPVIAAQLLQMYALEASLDYQEGEILVADGKATLALSEGFRYIPPQDAGRVLEAWGNPPGGGGMGMLVPVDVSLFSAEGWAVIVTYEEDGYVDDKEAATVDWDALLRDMQAGTEAGNEQRTELGLETIHLDRWAEPPHYDGTNNRLYWATVLRGDSGGASLNYDIRVLGRHGVLAMSAVAPVEQLAPIKVSMEDVITFARFNDGYRYDQFDPDIDTVAAYGIGALVAGKVASKAGLFAVLGALLLKGKKLLILAVLGLGAFARSLFGGSRDDQ